MDEVGKQNSMEYHISKSKFIATGDKKYHGINHLVRKSIAWKNHEIIDNHNTVTEVGNQLVYETN